MIDRDSFPKLVKNARAAAIRAHTVQMYGKYPYIKHLDDTHDVLVGILGAGATEDLRAAAYLHDVLEDTAVHYGDIKNAFGETVAELVYALTDELGRNRQERWAKTRPKLVGNARVLLVKFSDTIANVINATIESEWARKLYGDPDKLDKLAVETLAYPISDLSRAQLELMRYVHKVKVAEMNAAGPLN